jgi:hypothetical protein
MCPDNVHSGLQGLVHCEQVSMPDRLLHGHTVAGEHL